MNLLSSVRLSPEAVSGLYGQVNKKTRPARIEAGTISGLLFGTLQNDLLSVRVFRPLLKLERVENAAEDRDRLDALFQRSLLVLSTYPELSILQLVGWCSTRAVSDTAGLLQPEIEFHNRHFPRSTDLGLVVKLNKNGHLSLDLYTGSSAAPLSTASQRLASMQIPKNSALTGPFEVTMTGDRENQAAPPQAEIPKFSPESDGHNIPTDGKPSINPIVFASEAPIREATMAVEEASPVQQPEVEDDVLADRVEDKSSPLIRPSSRERDWSRLSWAGVSLLAACLLPALWYFRSSYRSRTVAASKSVSPSITSSDLDLRVEAQGDCLCLLVSWDRRSAAARSAVTAVLHIDDGLRHRRVELDSGDIANGSVLYKPGSGNVTFRLDVRDNRGTMTSWSTRALDATKPLP